jgi:hypothetical protein
MKIESLFNVAVEARVKTRIMCAKTGRVVKERPWQKNLILDVGLNGLAQDNSLSQSSRPASASLFCMVGSSNTPVKIASGAITFTQAGTTLTASAGFFTSSMVGSLFKWGTGSGGVEVYITAFTDTTHVTVQTAATVAVPEVGVVWNVQQTGLQTHLYTSNTYQTNSGDCQTTVTANSVTHQRTYIFPVQAAPYTVNEIGWNPATSTTRTMGRLVLTSSDIIGTSNFYVVVIAITYTYSPSVPTAVANVGTNIDTAGTAMIEWFGVSYVDSTGAVNSNGATAALDGSVGAGLRFTTVNYSQNATVPGLTSTLAWTGIIGSGSTTWAKLAATRGTMRATCTFTTSTSGQTAYGVGFVGTGNGSAVIFDIKFTTPFTLPTGTFIPSFVWQVVYDRALVN